MWFLQYETSSFPHAYVHLKSFSIKFIKRRKLIKYGTINRDIKYDFVGLTVVEWCAMNRKIDKKN